MHCATAYYWSDANGGLMRSRSISPRVLSGHVDIPAPPPRVVCDWERDITDRLGLEPGDVEPLSLPRARMRWPNYGDCVQAATDWSRHLGLQDVLSRADLALMACRGARYHQDAEHYGGAAFCNLFLSEDRGLDLHFPMTGQRIALTRGTVVLFDTAQPHAVIARTRSGFDAEDFAPGRVVSQVFLTWEVPLEEGPVADLLQIAFDTDAHTVGQLQEEQVWCDGARVRVCPQSGRWLRLGAG